MYVHHDALSPHPNLPYHTPPHLGLLPPCPTRYTTQIFYIVSWGVRLRVAWGTSIRKAVLLAPITFVFGLPYELIWDMLTALLGFIIGSPDLLNRTIRIWGIVCCTRRPSYFSLAPNLRVFRIKLLLEPLLNAFPQAVVQVGEEAWC